MKMLKIIEKILLSYNFEQIIYSLPFQFLAKECSSPPPDISPEDNGSIGSAYAIHTGTRYGPVCNNFNFGQVQGAPGISIEYSDNLPRVNREGFIITYDSNQAGGMAMDRVYFQFRFSLPLTKEAINVKLLIGLISFFQ